MAEAAPITKDIETELVADAANKAKISRRGAELAFNELSATFGARLLELVPTMWLSMVGGLLSVCTSGSSQISWFKKSTY